MKKKILGVFLAFSMLTLTACGNSGGSSNTSVADNNRAANDNNGADSTPENNTGGNSDTNTEVTKITISTSATTAPFSFTDDDNNVTGYDIDVARAVFERLPQYELEFEVIELHSTRAEVDAGRAQGSANNWNKTAEREEKYFFSDPILDCQYTALFAPDRDISGVGSLDDLAGLSTIVTAGSNVSSVLEDYNEQHSDNPIVINYSDEDFAKMAQDVQDGKYDFVLYPKVQFDIYNNEYHFGLETVDVGADITNSLFNGNPYAYFIISKDNEQLLKDVNAALAEIQLDGTVKAISERYFGEDYSASDWYK
ncbi:MAG: transporter substrate-binding domain-containing protein, partial [Oscillospiraceae bacterium]|nr:transporter substrate-binding domain-containing protein [Oscillospiraceae bacterium]